MLRTTDISRRRFIGSVAAAVSASAAAKGAAAQSASTQEIRTGRAPDGPMLRAGLIGCGGRGRGAAVNFLAAGGNLQIVALADVFPDRVAFARQLLNDQRGQQIPESRCFTGFDGYQKLLDSGVDVVLHATPPHFRPMHMAAVVDARKHLFIEKPMSVDVHGARLRVLGEGDHLDGSARVHRAPRPDGVRARSGGAEAGSAGAGRRSGPAAHDDGVNAVVSSTIG